MTPDTGSPDSNGNYSGMIGDLQRDDIDAMIGSIRFDSLKYFVVQPTTQGIPADVVIVSQQRKAYRTYYGLVQLWTLSFDKLTLMSTISSLYIFVVYLTFNRSPKRFLRRKSVKKFLRSLKKNITETLMSLMDQGNFPQSRRGSFNLLVLFFNLFLFFGVHGIVFGCLGADLIAWVVPPIVESLDEFTNTSRPSPTIVKNLWLKSFLDEVGPDERELWHFKQVLYSNEKENILDMPYEPVQSQESGLQFLQMIVNGTKAYIVPNYYYKGFSPFLCQVVNGTRFTASSKQLFAAGVMFPVMSRRIDPSLRIVFNYLIGTFVETGHAYVMLREIGEAFIPKFLPQIKLPLASECRIPPEYDPKDDDNDFTVATFLPLFKVCVILLLVSSITLTKELVTFSFDRFVDELLTLISSLSLW
jgi:hypothetical protein